MKKNGFTMIELIAVIAILGILFSMATYSALNVARRINERAYLNLISEIEIAAENYAIDTNKKIFFVQDLIDAGTIETEKDGFVYNPQDKQVKMNCLPIEIEIENGLYSSKIGPDSFVADETCDNDRLEKSSINLSIAFASNRVSGDCPTGKEVILVSNHGLYNKFACTGGNYSVNVSTTRATTYTISLRLEDNKIKTRTVTVNE